jgi:hypothetical protein
MTVSMDRINADFVPEGLERSRLELVLDIMFRPVQPTLNLAADVGIESYYGMGSFHGTRSVKQDGHVGGVGKMPKPGSSRKPRTPLLLLFLLAKAKRSLLNLK